MALKHNLKKLKIYFSISCLKVKADNGQDNITPLPIYEIKQYSDLCAQYMAYIHTSRDRTQR